MAQTTRIQFSKSVSHDNRFTRENSIAGGDNAREGEFPIMVSLQYYSNNNLMASVHFCGGILISPRHVLTAAHCLAKFSDVSRYRLVLGTSVLERRYGISRSASKLFLHPQFDSNSIKNDIGIIEMDQTVPLIRNRIVTSFLENASVPIDSTSLIAGWGIDSDASTTASRNLKRTFIHISPMYVCDWRLLGATSPNQFCAGYGDGKDSCLGDSGGGLFRRVRMNGEVIFVLEGIISYGPSLVCGGTNVGVYTNVTHYLDFIENVVKPYSIKTHRYNAEEDNGCQLTPPNLNDSTDPINNRPNRLHGSRTMSEEEFQNCTNSYPYESTYLMADSNLITTPLSLFTLILIFLWIIL